MNFTQVHIKGNQTIKVRTHYYVPQENMPKIRQILRGELLSGNLVYVVVFENCMLCISSDIHSPHTTRTKLLQGEFLPPTIPTKNLICRKRLQLNKKNESCFTTAVNQQMLQSNQSVEIATKVPMNSSPPSQPNHDATTAPQQIHSMPNPPPACANVKDPLRRSSPIP